MCGIAGVYGLEGIADAQGLAKGLTNSIQHRGPDASNTYTDESVVLVHTRLSILDLDERSNQPFKDPAGRYVLVFNGEIYNFKAVKKELSSYTFTTESDTEVLLAAWLKWGIDCLSRFNGMFAFTIWDKAKKELFIVRDRMGIKPVYFYQGDKNFVFGSELRALLNTGLVPRKLASEHLAEYLKYQTVHAPRTLLKDVFLIPAGSYLKIADATVTEHQYWKAEEQVAQRKVDAASVKAETKQLLIEAVDRRLVSDVRIGAFLSGGIDSSLLVGIIRKELNKPIDTFAITFKEKEFSEAKYSRMVAERFQTQHHEIELSSEDFKEKIPLALDAMDHPSGDGPNSYTVAEAVKKQGITVALSGLGGDELFAGYPFFTRHLDLQQKKYLLSFPPFIRGIIGKLLMQVKPGTTSQKIAETLSLPYFDLAYTYPVNRRVLAENWIAKLLGKETKRDVLSEEINDLFAFGTFGSRLPELSKVSLVELGTYMQNVLLRDTDQMSMAHALEVRVPFLDHKLVSHCLSISDKLKYPKYPKSLLIESFEGLLPDEVVHREKMGFVLPWENWLRNDLKSLLDSSFTFLSSTRHFDAMAIMELKTSFENKQDGINWSRVWPLVTLGAWMQKHEID